MPLPSASPKHDKQSLQPHAPEIHVSTTTKVTTTSSLTTRTASTTTGRNGEKVQIFLGGSCNPTTWRQTVAIPFLELNGISYYNPQVENWTPDKVYIEKDAKKNADWLLFVIDKQTRSTVSLVESAFMAGDGKRLVLVIYPFDFSINHLSIQSDTSQTSNLVEMHEETTTTSTTRHAASSLQLQSTLSSKSSTSSRSMTTSSSNFASGSIRVNGESLSLGEFQELRQARYILQSLLSSLEIPIFSEIPQALRYLSSCLTNANEESLEKSTKEQQSNLSFATSPCISPSTIHNQMGSKSSITNDEENSLKDVYLSLDDNGDLNVEATVITILQEKGLTFNYKPVRGLTDLSTLKPPIATSPDVPFSLNTLTPTHRYSMEENEQKIIQNSMLALEKEMKAIRSSRVILFVITNKCRGLSIMVLASHFMALFGRNVVLCIQYLEEPCCINGEILTKNAIADYNRGRVYLGDYAVETQVPVFETIREAVDCCSQKCGHNKNDTII